METGKMTKQMIKFNKAIVDNTYNGFSVMQDYSQSVLNGYLRQFPWMTEESQKPLTDSIEMMKKAQMDYKKALDKGFAQLEEMVSKTQ